MPRDYHPLFCFNQRSLLRRGNAHSAEDGRTSSLTPVRRPLPRPHAAGPYFRVDARIHHREIYTFLEAEAFKYTIRLPRQPHSATATPGEAGG